MGYEYIGLIGLFVAIFVFYFFHIQSKRTKYKDLALKLKANYISHSPFDVGRIIGVRSGRNFTIETFKTSSGRSSTFCTATSIDCNNKGIPLNISGAFFKNFPDWRAVHTIGEGKTKVFFTYIHFKNGLLPLDDKYKSQVQSIFQEFYLSDKDFILKGNIEIKKDKVKFSQHGILNDADKIQKILSLIDRIARRIESTPVV